MKYLLFLLILFTFSFCDDEHEKHHHYYNKDLTYLDLSHKQKKSIKELLKDYREDLKDYREYKEDILDEKQEFFEKDILNSKKIVELNTKLANKATKIEIILLENIHKILTKKQRELFIKHIEEWEIE